MRCWRKPKSSGHCFFLREVLGCFSIRNDGFMRCKPLLSVCKSDGVFDKVVEICS